MNTAQQPAELLYLPEDEAEFMQPSDGYANGKPVVTPYDRNLSVSDSVEVVVEGQGISVKVCHTLFVIIRRDGTTIDGPEIIEETPAPQQARTPGVSHKRDAIQDLVTLNSTGRARYTSGIALERDADGRTIEDGKVRSLNGSLIPTAELEAIEEHQDQIRAGEAGYKAIKVAEDMRLAKEADRLQSENAEIAEYLGVSAEDAVLLTAAELKVRFLSLKRATMATAKPVVAEGSAKGTHNALEEPSVEDIVNVADDQVDIPVRVAREGIARRDELVATLVALPTNLRRILEKKQTVLNSLLLLPGKEQAAIIHGIATAKGYTKSTETGLYQKTGSGTGKPARLASSARNLLTRGTAWGKSIVKKDRQQFVAAVSAMDGTGAAVSEQDGKDAELVGHKAHKRQRKIAAIVLAAVVIGVGVVDGVNSSDEPNSKQVQGSEANPRGQAPGALDTASNSITLSQKSPANSAPTSTTASSSTGKKSGPVAGGTRLSSPHPGHGSGAGNGINTPPPSTHKPAPEVGGGTASETNQVTLELRYDGANIWNATAAYLQANGYRYGNVEVDTVKDAVLREMNLSEKGAENLKLGFKFQIPHYVLSLIPREVPTR